MFMFNSVNTDKVLEIRTLYYQAYGNRAAADRFYKHMKANQNTEPIMMGYEGMAYLLQAKFAYNPYTKLTSFNKGKALLDKAILNGPGIIELRFMRYTVQNNAPSFLGYRGQLESDKAAIIKGWKSSDKDLTGRIKNYMAVCKECSDKERGLFK